ncbi:MAG: T9SS type A sorting domain-containing protein [Flavobacteriales bacterium]|nr:T9SS type A sorting domain-containing protein [Flavobacteriales bacterium]
MNFRTLSIPLFTLILAFPVVAQIHREKAEVSFITDIKRVPDVSVQAELRAGDAWTAFLSAHPQWVVEYNESSGMPRMAFGPPIVVAGSTPEERAMAFITAELSRFGVIADELELQATIPARRITYVHFKQVHEGTPVWSAKAMVNLDMQGRVIAFAADLLPSIPADLQPVLSEGAATAAANEGLTGITDAELLGRRYLPIPGIRAVDVRVVEELMVNTEGKRPGHHRCLVDLRSGELLYRHDEVVTEHYDGFEGNDDAADVQVEGTVHLNGATVPAVVQGLPDLQVTINGNNLFTDASGFLPTGIAGPVSAQIQLRGRWSRVTTGGTTPQFTTTLNEGSNTASFNSNSNLKERTAYYSVSNIHNHGNAVLPGFTGMDSELPTHVDVTGDTCNAFYDGTSINFYAQSATCRALSLYSDVVYHEYGHGINATYYQSQGGIFNNGAMNEGYADVWAITLTENPVMTLGWRFGFPDSYIRRYDENPKVYPIDIVGEVHRDGEIIAGAWWDTYRLLGWNMPLTLQLFADAFPGLQATATNGQEGQAYRDVLLAVLQADDDDSDLANGTPNGAAIVEAFAIHGITLLSNAQFNHTPVASALEGNTIPIAATLNLTFPFSTYVEGAQLHYRVTNNSPWLTVQMAINGSNYTSQIPAQPGGTIVAYYLTVQDIFGFTSSVTPDGAQFSDQGYLPNYVLVGFNLIATEDGDDNSELGNWTTSPQGNATTGQWEWGVLIGSYSTPGVASSIVQPAQQHTPGGFFCWFTGNASGPNAGLGENDVDAGSTILISDPINLAGYTNPAFTYWRWYSNNSGANPGADWWQVYISNNNGSTWVPVEDTKSSDRSWRRKAFRVQEYVTPSAVVRLKFIASDSLRPGMELNGGSLVEGALDDIQLWNGALNTLNVEETNDVVTMLYPSPTSDVLNLVLADRPLPGLSLAVVDLTGRTVLTIPTGTQNGNRHQLDVHGLADGHYLLQVRWEGGHTAQRFSILR